MIRAHMFIPNPAYSALKTHSAETGLSVSEITRRAIDAYLASLPQDHRRIVTSQIEKRI